MSGVKQFQYGIGAEFLFRFETRPVLENGKRERRYRYVKYKIENCRLHNGRVEYYNVNMTEEGKPAQVTELSASRLHYLINFNLEEMISAGKRRIYPLTAEEVAEFYKERNAVRYYENKRALNMLKSSKQDFERIGFFEENFEKKIDIRAIRCYYVLVNIHRANVKNGRGVKERQNG